MKEDYSLRRRTRDSSWQWLTIGMILGLGVALVVCVGGYALGALTFPPLEADTATPRVLIEPNQTEVALQSGELPQTPAVTEEEAVPGTEDALADVPRVTEADPLAAGDEGIAAQPPDSVTEQAADPSLSGAGESTEQAFLQSTPLPTPLPGSDGVTGDGGQAPLTPPAAQQEAVGGAGEGGVGAQDAGASALAQDTPVVGTPPVGQPTQTITFNSGASLPPELDSIKTEMVLVTGGSYMMGTNLEEANQAMDECALYGKTCDDLSWVSDSTPAHQVTVDSFNMDLFEVSVTQYVAFLNWMGPNSHRNQCQGQPCVKTTVEEPNSYIEFDGSTYAVRNAAFYSNHPVTWVTWWGADAYCRALDRRLPTEAEWERAARGPQNYIYPWGFEFADNANSSVPAAEGTEPVDSYPNGRSSFDIYNMAGNAEEWVADWYQSDYYTQQAASQNPVSDPQGPPSGAQKVLRGGSWDTIPLFLRTVHRRSAAPDQPTASIGFRCVSDDVNMAAPPAAPANQGGAGGADSAEATPGGAPTMAPVPTRQPAGPTATLAPG
ncbi:MAG: SUMF1/EgtB/PvdO family nonheme iron enzyme [Chloroflexi bacterium]|nr:SUMF1/EgtB/PvdO family nonheme iron enzyme [Chloroflexota bacterium]